ncbi:hypothetical protein ACFQ0K_08265 [Nocardioides caeni]|uniref:hypothetical protein n=1 Tax=Nocardioides caeni TaxID=574700 RepID=UPI0013053BEE|nr:hypothetical protein [Nocardioides caeni]
MNLRPALAAFTLALVLTGCGDDSPEASDSSEAPDRSDTSSDTGSEARDEASDEASESGDDSGSAPAPAATSPEEVYTAFRAALEDGDVDALRGLVREDYWSDLQNDGDTLDERLAVTSAQVAEGSLVLPEEPSEVQVGAEEIGIPPEYLDQAKADDVALLVLPDADPDGSADGPGDVHLILLQVEGAWVVFGMEPS